MELSGYLLAFLLAWTGVDLPDTTLAPGNFPPAVAGGTWVLDDPVRTFAGKELFELIDGGAPLYFEYGFHRARAARYRSVAGGGLLAVEAFELRSDEGACGLFSYLSAGTGEFVDSSSDLVAGSGFLLARQGRLVWSFTALDQIGPDTLIALARTFAGRTSLRHGGPSILRWLNRVVPEAGPAVLFFGPLGFQKFSPPIPDGLVTIGTGVEAEIPGGALFVLENRSQHEAGTRDSLLRRHFGVAGGASSRHGSWQAALAVGRWLLGGTRSHRLVLISGTDMAVMKGLWERLGQR